MNRAHPHTPDPPAEGKLRKFGLVFASGMRMIFGLLLPWLFDRPWPLWPWIAAACSLHPHWHSPVL